MGEQPPGFQLGQLRRREARLICVRCFQLDPRSYIRGVKEIAGSSPSFCSPFPPHQTKINAEDSSTIQPHDGDLNDQTPGEGQLPATGTPPSSSQDVGAAVANGSAGDPTRASTK
ncbi:hypothetical protein A1Q2_00363 [Trichosporon asahii var. asahii CBS 8904]|uniref:Uncharacterized protein n=2 Tax=Trichosporon asahii var. asahii TaxID=189963 RepID=K1W0J7_TRIAC|nr:hypothetical protein A1Q1_01335 [Trichosporon asahii var. asahii CBS 2479]EJT52840.1 hypothetical protein A1Q1_01335 [Trichosporon asahii var. asahii CBS 2479]EKD05337.1 hypothetical protein A1Q2_00363 [Trichosporon asahii var. asahii CBS 8904]